MHTESPRLIRLPEVSRLTGLGKSQVYALARAGNFPSPVKLSERCSAFIYTDVLAWVDERIAAARKGKPA